MIDLYCERMDPAFWSEPLNALSNLAFIIAAWAIWRLGNRIGKIDFSIGLLISLILAIGIGSFLFHTFATTLTMYLDIIPILLFQLLFIWIYFRHIIQLSKIESAGFLVVYIILALLSKQFPQILNGSLSYAAAFLILFGLGLYHFIHRKREQYLLIAALGAFSLALFFRTIDNIVCPYFQIGTHFLWHLLNGGVVYLSARALMLNLSNYSDAEI